MPRTGENSNKLWYWKSKVDQFRDEKEQNCSCEMANDCTHRDCNSGKVRIRISNEYFRWIEVVIKQSKRCCDEWNNKHERQQIVCRKFRSSTNLNGVVNDDSNSNDYRLANLKTIKYETITDNSWGKINIISNNNFYRIYFSFK